MTGTSEIQYYDLPDNQGCRMAYRTFTPSSSAAASSTPLFLINGLSAVMEDWSPLFEALGATRPVLISDHRGIGCSTTSPDWDQELSLELMGLDVINLASHLGYSAIDLLGFSMGGHIIQAIISSPDHAKVAEDGTVLVNGKVKVRKAILTATMTKLPRGDIDLNALNAEAAKITDTKKRNDFITYNMMVFQYHPEALGSNGSLQHKLEQRLQLVRNTSRPAWVIGLQFMAIQAGDLREQLHRIPETVPVMVVHGRKDRMVLYKESDVICEKIAHAERLSDVPSGEFGHLWYDYFELQYWVKSVSNFLDNGKVGGQGRESKL
ncbi:uncharacterized protein UBRO_07623 [Ustilago bromivora]|uniref:AB hydrolase-1 domain-containing protein n=1 Tax=Ustilago bromivora TaxID=307758 RepID=A0A1K0HJA8_9BASI|nr:uncharacterized protein UBRO_07623 [Ustilago bromivora]SYW77724.1 uncharacterized protein UBRO2_01916 [Ustilago bromivora]